MFLLRSYLAFYFCLLIAGQDTSRANSLDGVRIRAAVAHMPPLVNVKNGSDGNVTITGIDKDIFDLIVEQLNIPCDYVVMNESDTAKYGIHLASRLLLNSGTIDAFPMATIPTTDKLKERDFTMTTAIHQYRFLVKYPDEESPLLVLIMPFQLKVWILIGIVLVIVVVSLSILMYWLQEPGERKPTSQIVSENALYVLRILTQQGEPLGITKVAVRIVAGIWCLMAVVLSCGYTGNLTSSLAVSQVEPIPQSFEDLAAQLKTGQSTLTIEFNSTQADDFLNSGSGLFRLLGDSLLANPQNMFKTRSEGITNVINRKCTYLGKDALIFYVVNDVLKRTGQCKMTVSNRLPYFQYNAISLAKNSAYKKAVDEKIQILWESGILEHVQKKYVPRIDKCLLKNRKHTRLAPLTTKNLYCAFFVLGVGVSLSLVVFAAENLIFLLNKLKMGMKTVTAIIEVVTDAE